MKDTQNITYTFIDNEIHWIKLNNSSRQTVEDIFAQLTEIVKSATLDEPILYLLDSGEVDELPFRYLMQRAKLWEAEQDYLPPVRNAILQSQNKVMMVMVNVMMRVFSKHQDKTQLFDINQHDEAISWLRSNA